MLRTTRVEVEPTDLRRALDNLVRRRKPVLVRWLDQMLTTSKTDISFDEIATAVATGNVDGPYLNRWRQRYARYINKRVVPAWNDAQQSGADVMIPGLEGTLGDDIEFALLGERMDRWTRERAGTLVAGLTDNQRTALSGMVRQFSTFDRRNPREVARFIRPLIGLTPRDAESLAKQQRKRIEKGDESDEAIRRDVANQALTRVRRRAETIAETELAYAYNFGGWHAVKDADDEGAFGDDVPVKRWWTQLDERVCPFCGPLHDTLIGMDETFPGKTQIVPNTQAPPAHPRCRCVLLYEFIESEDPAEPDTPVEDEVPGAVPGEDGEPVVYNQPLDEAEFDAIMTDEAARLRREIGFDHAELALLSADVGAKRRAFFDIPGASLAVPFRTPESGRAFEAYSDALDAFEDKETRLISAFNNILSNERQDAEYRRRRDINSFGTVTQPTGGQNVYGQRYIGTYRRQTARERRETDELQREMMAFFRRSLPPESVRDDMSLEIGAERRRPRAHQRTRISDGWTEPNLPGNQSSQTAINVGSSVKDGDGQRVVYHELGHTVEMVNGRVSDAAQIFYQRRTAGESLTWLGSGYGRNEKSRRDKWFDAYVGKEYHAIRSEETPRTRSTEVVSMSLDRFSSAERLSRLAIEDPEHLAFSFAVMRGRFGWRP